jgi:hypothetical protein
MSANSTARRTARRDVKALFYNVYNLGVESANKVDPNKLADMIYELDANKATSLRSAWASEEGKEIAMEMADAWSMEEKEAVSKAYKDNYEQVGQMEKKGVGKTLQRLHLGARLLHDMKQIM